MKRSDSRPYRPPTRRRLQLEAWTVIVLILAGSWCLAGGVWLGLKLIWNLARLIAG